jgi:hypothetical protein
VIIVAYAVLMVAIGLGQNDAMWRRIKRDVTNWNFNLYSSAARFVEEMGRGAD